MSEEENEKITLDLSRKRLKKVPKQDDAQNVRILILDENELQKIDNIDSYLKIEKLSLCKNQLLRMYGVCRLHCLRELNLSFNGILSIEGLKDCVHLRHLNLEGNNIKTIEHLTNNINLMYLNLAENSIGSISDISFLKCLKELYLHSNRLTHLRQCDKYLPPSIEFLTLAKNNISDLNEICNLTHLNSLNSITIGENPCVSITARPDGFDYRPFVLNWCMSLKVIDSYVVDPIESLKAEWLYSQGRGRSFRLGEQAALAKYLSSVCPLIGKALENENERKLRLILSKAQHHQRQLQEEISENTNSSLGNSPSSGRKKPASRIQSPRFSRLCGRQGSPESMVNSYHGNTTSEQLNNSNSLEPMTTSLIENVKTSDISQIMDSTNQHTTTNNNQEMTPRSDAPNSFNNVSKNGEQQQQQSLSSNTPAIGGGPLVAASKMLPVPEALMSPDICPTAIAQRVTVTAINSQLQQHPSKVNKNKDNHLNSPKMRSPHLKRHSERSPISSPRKVNTSASATMTVNATKTISSEQHRQQHQHQHQQQSISNDKIKKLRSYANNAVHVTTQHDTQSGEGSSDDDSDHINIEKLKTIRNKAAQRCQQMKLNMENSNMMLQGSANTESSAVVIQKMWRGYRTRKKTKDIAEKLLKKRTYEYIDKLTKDMEMTKAQLENERKIQQLQMQAINALWKRVSSMQSGMKGANGGGDVIASDTSCSVSATGTLSLDNNCSAVVNDLTKTCSLLTNQVQQLQGSMRDILNCLTLFCNLPQENVKRLLKAGVSEALPVDDTKDSAATQTEIVAVHTPQMENFPFNRIRPSTLPLTEFQKQAANQTVQAAESNCNSNSNTASTTTDTEKPIQSPLGLNGAASLDESGVVSEDFASTGDTESIDKKFVLDDTSQNVAIVTPTNTPISSPTIQISG